MISVVIPTLDEVERLPGLLARLAAEPTAHEVIVADGGSRDATLAIAGAAGVRVLRSEPGRGQQLGAGAAVSHGDILLFLHADCRFPAGGLAAVEAALRRAPACPGGNFRLIFDGDTPFSRWLTRFYARIRARGLYYGDSAVFVRRSAFRTLGGIRPIALMEDYDLTRRLERLGPTCCIGEPPLVTSSRRFEGRHPVAIVFGWIELHILFHLGVSPGFLAKRYARQCRRAVGGARHIPVTKESEPT